MSLVAFVFAIGWPGAAGGPTPGPGGLLDVLVTLGLVGLVCWLAATTASHREKERSQKVLPFRPALR
jgi:hypothetical protein